MNNLSILLNTDKKVISGLIFWIDRGSEDGRENKSVIDKIGNFYMNQECVYETIALVDNKRAQFLYQLLSYTRSKYGKETLCVLPQKAISNTTKQLYN